MNVEEIYCRSCGEQIKVDAELCPHCGVRNQAQHLQTGGGRTRNAGGGGYGQGTPSPQTGGPRTGTGTSQAAGTASASPPSDNWVYAVGIAAGLWVLTALLDAYTLWTVRGITGGFGGTMASTEALPSMLLGGPVQFVAWILLPIGLYFDAKYVRHETQWDVPVGLFVGFAVLSPIISSVIGVVSTLVVGFRASILAGIVISLLTAGVAGYYLKRRQDLVSS